MCCTCLAENTGRKKSPKIRHLGTIAQLCRAVSSQLRQSTIGKKLLKQQYLLSVQCGEIRPTSRWDRFGSFGHPSKFQRVSRLAFVALSMSLTGGQPNFARCLAVFWAGNYTRCVIITGTPNFYGAKFSQYAVYLHKNFRVKARDNAAWSAATICTAFTV